jgi:hypothetical protein
MVVAKYLLHAVGCWTSDVTFFFQRDVPARYLLHLGQGEQELATDVDFSGQGRANAMLVRRLELLGEVSKLARSLRLPEDVGYTCETAAYFWLLHVYARWEQFLAACAQNEDKPTLSKTNSPFQSFSQIPHSLSFLASLLRKICMRPKVVSNIFRRYSRSWKSVELLSCLSQQWSEQII